MRMKLKLDRFDQNWKHLEHREQWSRSFTLGFIEQLYVMASQPLIASPFAGSSDVNRVIRSVDVEPVVTGAGWGMNTTLKMGAPAGLSTIITPGFSSGSNLSPYVPVSAFNGCDVGIQVGGDNTAATPTDRRLVQRFGHGRRPADGAALVFDSYTLNDDTDFTMNGAGVWGAHEFIPKISHRITSVLVKIWKTGAPGDLTVSIKGEQPTADVNTEIAPTSAICPDLAVGTILQAAIPGASPGALTEAVFGTPIDLYAGHRYCIVCRALGSSGGNSVQWRYDAAGSTYEGGLAATSADVFTRKLDSGNSGASWTRVNASTFLFQEKGQSIGELEYGGCDLDGITFADPNGSFDIRRFFNNKSGENRVIQEVGIHAMTQRDHAADNKFQNAHVHLIARDVVAPAVTVLNNEILLVTYTPSITV